MKHCIIVKFKNGFDYIDHIDDITCIFRKTLKIEGITDVAVKRSNSDRKNRFDLMIEITMEKYALNYYDVSLPHEEWKHKYSEFIDEKAIFDYE